MVGCERLNPLVSVRGEVSILDTSPFLYVAGGDCGIGLRWWILGVAIIFILEIGAGRGIIPIVIKSLSNQKKAPTLIGVRA